MPECAYMVCIGDLSWGDVEAYYDDAYALASHYAEMGEEARMYRVTLSIPTVTHHDDCEDYSEEIDRELIKVFKPLEAVDDDV